MTEEAISSLRTLFLSTLGILLLWFLTYPSAVTKLKLYSEIRDLHTWLYLQEELAKYIEDVFGFKADENIDHRIVTYESGDGYYAEMEEPLTLQILWPDVKTVSVELIPADHYQREDRTITDEVRIYRVVPGSGDDFPTKEYFVVFLRGLGVVKVVSVHDSLFLHNSSLGLRQVIQAAHEGHKFHYWDHLSLHLLKYGYDGGIGGLSTKSEALAKLRAEIDPRTAEGGVQLFGLKLSIDLFFSSVGILLAAVAFAMIGPLTALQSADAKNCRHPWIFLLPFKKSLTGVILETIIILVTIMWAGSPLFVLSLQQGLESQVGDLSGSILVIGKLGLLFAAIVQGIAAYQLGRFRFITG